MRSGDDLLLLDGMGTQATGVITDPHHKRCGVKIISRHFVERSKPRLHIAIAPVKLNDRMEWFLEKVTEAGVDEITPVICHRSERKVINHERYQKVLLSAMKQSMNRYLPILNQAVSFNHFVSQCTPGYIAHCMDGDKIPVREILTGHANITVLIGPEGDFNPDEVKAAQQKGWKSLSLGTNRLRTETAGVAVGMIVGLLAKSSYAKS